MAVTGVTRVWPAPAGASGASGPTLATTSYSPDGTTVTLGTADGDGYRSVSGGGLPAGLLRDPQSLCSIVSNSGASRWEITLSGAATSGHWGPMEHSNWYLNSPALVFDGIAGDGTKIIVDNCDFHVDATVTANRISVGAITFAPDKLFSGVQCYSGTDNTIIGEYGPSSKTTIQGDTSVTYPVKLAYRHAITDRTTTPVTREGLSQVAAAAEVTSTRPKIGTNYCIGFSGTLADTYYFGDIRLTLLDS